MPPELSMRLRHELPGELPEEEAGFGPAPAPAPASRIEQRIIEYLCEPVLPYIPARVHPNTISLVTHAVAWLTATSAVVSAQLPHGYRSLALVAAGLGMLLSMIGDCLDGMHARRTKQCSKVGEMMDHWLDTIIVPLATIGSTFALEMEPWAIVIVNITAAMVYHGQLVLYHHTGKFIHPEPANGVEAQFGVSVGYVALAGLFYFVNRDSAWLDVAITCVAVVGIFVQMRCNWFYYVRLGKLVRYHLIFVAMCTGFGLLYLLGAMDIYAFALTLVFTSFRISGTYVLTTILGRRYDGNDWPLWGWIAAIAAGHLWLDPIVVGGVSLQGLLPYLACVTLLVQNGLDFSRHYADLRD